MSRWLGYHLSLLFNLSSGFLRFTSYPEAMVIQFLFLLTFLRIHVRVLSLYAKDYMPFPKYKAPKELLPDAQSLSLDSVSVLDLVVLTQITELGEPWFESQFYHLLSDLEQFVYSLSALVLSSMRWSWWLNANIYIKVPIHCGHRIHFCSPPLF